MDRSALSLAALQRLRSGSRASSALDALARSAAERHAANPMDGAPSFNPEPMMRAVEAIRARQAANPAYASSPGTGEPSRFDPYQASRMRSEAQRTAMRESEPPMSMPMARRPEMRGRMDMTGPAMNEGEARRYSSGLNSYLRENAGAAMTADEMNRLRREYDRRGGA